jgi:hypothetical protein
MHQRIITIGIASSTNIRLLFRMIDDCMRDLITICNMHMYIDYQLSICIQLADESKCSNAPDPTSRKNKLGIS